MGKWLGSLPSEMSMSLALAYTMAKYGMSMCVLGMAEEFRGQISVNALWPKTGKLMLLCSPSSSQLTQQLSLASTTQTAAMSGCCRPLALRMAVRRAAQHLHNIFTHNTFLNRLLSHFSLSIISDPPKMNSSDPLVSGRCHILKSKCQISPDPHTV